MQLVMGELTLANTEDLLYEEEDQLLLIFLIHLPIECLQPLCLVWPHKVRDPGRWFPQLNLSHLVDIDTGSHGVAHIRCVLLQSGLERDEVKLRIIDHWDEGVGHH